MDDDAKLAAVVVLAPILCVTGVVIAVVSPGGERYLIMGMSLVFIVTGIFLCSGKAVWIVAGVNTMSAEEREKFNKEYNIKAVEKGAGLILIFSGIGVLFAFADVDGVVKLSLILIFILVPLIIMILLPDRLFKKIGLG